ncbi:NAD(P)-dependent oxidoreductase [Oscillospiraceae bacterium 50-16]
MKKAIVTGANGFVGSAVVRELSGNGVQVWAVVRNESSNIMPIMNLPNVQIVYCELSEMEQLAQKIPERRFDVFYHFAWAGSAGLQRGDYKLQLANARSTCDAVQACHELNAEKFIFAASIMEYECIEMMKTEHVPGMGMMYNSGKVAADFMAKTLAASLGIVYISAIISNIYGPGEHSPRLINTTIRKLLQTEHTAFTPADQQYDFIYIDDAAKAFAVLGKKQVTRTHYYVGNTQTRPLKEFLFLLRNCVDPFAELGIGELPFQGVPLDYSQLDLKALNRDTGFCPAVTFQEGIQRTKEWIERGESCKTLPLRN